MSGFTVPPTNVCIPVLVVNLEWQSSPDRFIGVKCDHFVLNAKHDHFVRTVDLLWWLFKFKDKYLKPNAKINLRLPIFFAKLSQAPAPGLPEHIFTWHLSPHREGVINIPGWGCTRCRPPPIFGRSHLDPTKKTVTQCTPPPNWLHGKNFWDENFLTPPRKSKILANLLFN